MPNRVGQELGNYRLIRLLGSGGFAEVYLALHLHLKTQAAVKVLHTHLQTGDISAFLKEAQTVARLKHPHIIRVFDFDVKETIPFLVMDYLPNETLRQLHPKNIPVALDKVVSYVLQVSDALQYAHDEHIMHRDIKPENMLLDQHHQVILSDFGIARMVQTSRAQSTQDVAGTAAYMAPEQFQGKPRRASDQYSLGVVVYEWLSGERPFSGSFGEIASQHLFVPPPSLQSKTPLLPLAIEEIVLKALAKDPDERFPSVQAFALALEQASQRTSPSLAYDPQGSLSPPMPPATSEVASAAQPQIPPSSLIPSAMPEVAYPAQSHTGSPSLNLSPHQTAQSVSEFAPIYPDAINPYHGTPQPSASSTGQTSISPSLQASIDHNRLSHRPLSSFPGSNSHAPIFAPFSHNNVATTHSKRRYLRNIVLLIIILFVSFASIAGISYFTHLGNIHIQGNIPVSVLKTPQYQKTASAATVQALAPANPDPYPPYNGRLVLYDPLTDNKAGYGWREYSEIISPGYASDGQKNACQFINGEYHDTSAENYGGACLAKNTDFGNFAYEIEMKFVRMAPNWSGGGIVFRAQGDKYYYFEVFESGRYTLVSCNGNDCTNGLTKGPPTLAPSFHTGLNQSNIIAVVADSDTFNLYINKQQIFGPVSDTTYSHGQIVVYGEGGYDASAVEGGSNLSNVPHTETEVVYSNARVWQL